MKNSKKGFVQNNLLFYDKSFLFILKNGLLFAVELAKKRGLNINLLNEVVEKLQNGIALEEKYYDHELKGKYKGFCECHIQPDWLLMYLKEHSLVLQFLIA